LSWNPYAYNHPYNYAYNHPYYFSYSHRHSYVIRTTFYV
jgi:hypothetical protein